MSIVTSNRNTHAQNQLPRRPNNVFTSTGQKPNFEFEELYYTDANSDYTPEQQYFQNDQNSEYAVQNSQTYYSEEPHCSHQFNNENFPQGPSKTNLNPSGHLFQCFKLK